MKINGGPAKVGLLGRAWKNWEMDRKGSSPPPFCLCTQGEWEPMQKLIQGIHQFQKESFRPLQGLFEELAKGHNPETLFITCSDSRIDPTLLTKAQPGDLFILRNAGNIIPPHGAGNGGEAATIEFAVAALNRSKSTRLNSSHSS